MNSFILVSKDSLQQEKYVNTFVVEHTISPFDITKISEEEAIGIEIIRKLQETLFLMPYKGQEKIIILEHAENLTIEAQNALLKILEEPPAFVFIFLCSTTEDVFLPTILSRCKVIHLEKKVSFVLSEEDRHQYTSILVCLTEGTIGEKLALAETLATDKENLGNWFETITYFVREKMLADIENQKMQRQYAKILTSLQEGYKTFSTTNVSPRAILEHTFLTIYQ